MSNNRKFDSHLDSIARFRLNQPFTFQFIKTTVKGLPKKNDNCILKSQDSIRYDKSLVDSSQLKS